MPLALCILLAACGQKARGPIAADAPEGYCPVCHMKVKAADQWASEIIYADGTKLIFESPADMLTFQSAPEKYDVTAAQKDPANVTAIYVKDYQTKDRIDARQARLVYKSKVQGPMGPDVIAFNKSEEAEAFAAANGGTVLSLNQLTSDMIENLRKKQ